MNSALKDKKQWQEENNGKKIVINLLEKFEYSRFKTFQRTLLTNSKMLCLYNQVVMNNNILTLLFICLFTQ